MIRSASIFADRFIPDIPREASYGARENGIRTGRRRGGGPRRLVYENKICVHTRTTCTHVSPVLREAVSAVDVTATVEEPILTR